MRVSLTYTARKLLGTSVITTALAVMAATAIAALVDTKTVIGACGVTLAAMLFYRHPLLLLSLFAAVSAMDAVFPSAALLRFAGIKFLPADPVYAFMFIHFVLCTVRRPRATLAALRENICLVLFIGLVAVSVAVYTPIHGQSAIGEARKFYFMFLFPLVAAISVRRPDQLRRFLLVVVMVGAIIAAIGLVKAASTLSIVRVINSEGTLIMALVALSLLVLKIHRVVLISPAIDKGLLAGLLVLSIGAAHRTVWLAIAGGLIVTIWLHRSRPVVFVKIAMVGIAMLISAGSVLVYFPGAGLRLAEKFAGLIDPYSDKNASWRIEGWRQQFEQVREENLLLGEGVGTYYSWKYKGNLQTVAPHNAYIQLLLKFGLVGLGVYALLAIRFFRRTAVVRKKLEPGWMKACVEIGFVNVAAGHGYTLGYGFEPIMLCYFAIAMSAAIVRGKGWVYETSEARTLSNEKSRIWPFSPIHGSIAYTVPGQNGRDRGLGITPIVPHCS